MELSLRVSLRAIRHSRAIIISISLSILCSCKKEGIGQYVPVESYPEDTVLNSLDNKRAMVVTAHDDDMCLMAGTISKLNHSGWDIIHMYIPGPDIKGRIAHKNAASHVLDSIVYITADEGNIRFDLDTVEYAYSAIPKKDLPNTFNYPAVQKQLVKTINQFVPSVIFTLDNEIGGYGHPGHVFISQLVLDLAVDQKIKTGYIFQNVMTPHMVKTIIEGRHSRRMKSWGYSGDGWERAKKVYRVDGMPLPTTQIRIVSEAENKMKYLRAYTERQRKTMGFFLPAFEEYDAGEYFQLFDREFFRVIKLQ